MRSLSDFKIRSPLVGVVMVGTDTFADQRGLLADI